MELKERRKILFHIIGAVLMMLMVGIVLGSLIFSPKKPDKKEQLKKELWLQYMHPATLALYNDEIEQASYTFISAAVDYYLVDPEAWEYGYSSGTIEELVEYMVEDAKERKEYKDGLRKKR